MSHYSTLQDYRFEAGADDIRGARIFDERGVELAHVQDVVFDHSSGEIRYLVAKYGSRRVLVPLNRVSHSIDNKDSFSSDITRQDLDQLPEFDDRSMTTHDHWSSHEKLHRSTMEKNQRFSKDYKNEWKADPALHRESDLAHTITPAEVPGSTRSTASATRDRDDYVPDVTPQRIAPVFGSTENTSDKLHKTPQTDATRGAGTEPATTSLGPRWNMFAEGVRRDLNKIRGGCSTCKEDERAA